MEAVGCERVLLGGGVSANGALGARLRAGVGPGGSLLVGSIRVSLDNGAMIARAAQFRHAAGLPGLDRAAAAAPIPGMLPWRPEMRDRSQDGRRGDGRRGGKGTRSPGGPAGNLSPISPQLTGDGHASGTLQAARRTPDHRRPPDHLLRGDDAARLPGGRDRVAAGTGSTGARCGKGVGHRRRGDHRRARRGAALLRVSELSGVRRQSVRNALRQGRDGLVRGLSAGDRIDRPEDPQEWNAARAHRRRGRPRPRAGLRRGPHRVLSGRGRLRPPDRLVGRDFLPKGDPADYAGGNVRTVRHRHRPPR